MPKFKSTRKFDRRGNGAWFYLAIVVLAFGIYSMAVAANTHDKCGSASKEWIIFPPEWRCETRPGFG